MKPRTVDGAQSHQGRLAISQSLHGSTMLAHTRNDDGHSRERSDAVHRAGQHPAQDEAHTQGIAGGHGYSCKQKGPQRPYAREHH